MWNEGNMRVASNFTLQPSSQVRSDPGKPRTAIWCSMEEGKLGTFACRFRTQEECDDFIDKCNLYCLHESQSDDTKHEEEPCNKSNCNEPPSPNPSKPENPPTESCPGCVGCNPDNYTFPSIGAIVKIETTIECQLGCSCSDAPDVVELEAMLGAN